MKRFSLFNAVLEKIVQLNLEQSEKIYLHVNSSHLLSGEQKEALEKKFFHMLKKPVVASYEIDSTLLGGVKVFAEGKTYDGSVEGWLGAIQALA
jgi:F-type H+-transporting ATPase subunit delta